jgi:hypothetical protein
MWNSIHVFNGHAIRALSSFARRNPFVTWLSHKLAWHRHSGQPVRDELSQSRCDVDQDYLSQTFGTFRTRNR